MRNIKPDLEGLFADGPLAATKRKKRVYTYTPRPLRRGVYRPDGEATPGEVPKRPRAAPLQTVCVTTRLQPRTRIVMAFRRFIVARPVGAYGFAHEDGRWRVTNRATGETFEAVDGPGGIEFRVVTPADPG